MTDGLLDGWPVPWGIDRQCGRQCGPPRGWRVAGSVAGVVARNGGRRADSENPICFAVPRCARISELPKRSHRLAA
ncbi:hypothetical protein PSCLAVI8L_140102 [Pseudoclavibacter sp. 8L]|nr:hypothetical protein PSCLAVI8L_140102 [Pseudoclavibacter sp. 8L]